MCLCDIVVVSIVYSRYVDRLILIGDPMQLTATVISTEAKKCLYERSLMERLIGNEIPAHRFLIQVCAYTPYWTPLPFVLINLVQLCFVLPWSALPYRTVLSSLHLCTSEYLCDLG